MCFHFESFMIDSFSEAESANYNGAPVNFIYFLCSIVSSWWTMSCISINILLRNTPCTSIFLLLKYYHIQKYKLSLWYWWNISQNTNRFFRNYYHSKLFWTNSIDIMPKLASNCRIMISFWIHLRFIRSIVLLRNTDNTVNLKIQLTIPYVWDDE